MSGAAVLTIIAALAGAAGAETPRLRSATEYLSPELRGEQVDAQRNRAMLWVDEGRRLWQEAPGPGAPACSGCHGVAPEALRGAAARYPAIDAASGTLMNLEGRINACRTRHQQREPLSYESEPLLALTALIAFQSRGLPIAVAGDGAAAAHLEAGRRFYATRQGQLDLACSQCHDDNAGRKLRGDTISSGLGGGYPAYRLEWQGLGSLHRRLNACQIGVRAEELEPGSPEHLALELFLAWRGRGQPMEAPAIRR